MGLKDISVGEQDLVESTSISVDQLTPSVVDNKLTSPGPVHADTAAEAAT